MKNAQLASENDALVLSLSKSEECLLEVVAIRDDLAMDLAAAQRRLRTSAHDNSVSPSLANRPRVDDLSATSAGGAGSRSASEGDCGSGGVRSGICASLHGAQVAASAARMRCVFSPVLPEIAEWEVHRDGGRVDDAVVTTVTMSSNPFA